MKNLFTTIIALLLPMLASAQHYSPDYKDDNGYFYMLNPTDHTAMITYEWAMDYIGDWTYSKSYSGNIVIPSSFVNRDDGLTYTVTGIDDHAFYQCDGLTSVTIPSSVTIIEWDAFSECTNLTTLTIDAGSVVEISGYTFYGCTNLTTLNIPSSVTRINEDAFGETGWYNSQPNGLVYAGNVAYKYKGTMPNGTNIIIKSGTVGISSGAFRECSGLSSITIPNGVKFIGSEAFSGCTSLLSVDIPVGVTSIENGTFSGCSSLTSVTIPEGVTNIGGEFDWGGAFGGCNSLTSITIPSSVSSIYTNAFKCKNLLSVTSYITKPFNTSHGSGSVDMLDKIFSENTYRNGTLYVPAGTKDLYTRYDGWRDFLNIEEMAGQTYYLTIIDSQNGSVDVKVKLGDKYTLRISPANGRTVKNVYYNDDDVTKQLDANNCFTTPAISANSTLRVVYKGDKRGDLNGDDKVDVADHVELSEIIMNQQENE
jgi:hypothetical protein